MGCGSSSCLQETESPKTGDKVPTRRPDETATNSLRRQDDHGADSSPCDSEGAVDSENVAIVELLPSETSPFVSDIEVDHASSFSASIDEIESQDLVVYRPKEVHEPNDEVVLLDTPNLSTTRLDFSLAGEIGLFNTPLLLIRLRVCLQ